MSKIAEARGIAGALARAETRIAVLPEGSQPRPVLAFRCPHVGCGKRAYMDLRGAARHASRCIHNHSERTCATCGHDEAMGCMAGIDKGGAKLVRGCGAWVDPSDLIDGE